MDLAQNCVRAKILSKDGRVRYVMSNYDYVSELARTEIRLDPNKGTLVAVYLDGEKIVGFRRQDKRTGRRMAKVHSGEVRKQAISSPKCPARTKDMTEYVNGYIASLKS